MFMNRLEPMRRYSFGVIGIYGDEPALELCGVLCWRGLDVPQQLIDHPSFEYYQRRKLDLNNAEDKALLENYWTDVTVNESVVEGRTLRDYRPWK